MCSFKFALPASFLQGESATLGGAALGLEVRLAASVILVGPTECHSQVDGEREGEGEDTGARDQSPSPGLALWKEGASSPAPSPGPPRSSPAPHAKLSINIIAACGLQSAVVEAAAWLGGGAAVLGRAHQVGGHLHQLLVHWTVKVVAKLLWQGYMTGQFEPAYIQGHSHSRCALLSAMRWLAICALLLQVGPHPYCTLNLFPADEQLASRLPALRTPFQVIHSFNPCHFDCADANVYVHVLSAFEAGHFHRQQKPRSQRCLGSEAALPALMPAGTVLLPRLEVSWGNGMGRCEHLRRHRDLGTAAHRGS